MNPPDLHALQSGDADARNEAFDWLWPAAFTVARLKLQPFFPEDVEDVSIETLEELVDAVRLVKKVEELRPLTASIAHNRAVSRLRERFAAKRGQGQIVSLEALQGEDEHDVGPATLDSPLSGLEKMELASLLREIQMELKPEHREILSDFFLHGLSYDQIAGKRGVAIGSVGVYLKRGLEAIRKQGLRNPRLLKDLEAFLR